MHSPLRITSKIKIDISCSQRKKYNKITPVETVVICKEQNQGIQDYQKSLTPIEAIEHSL